VKWHKKILAFFGLTKGIATTSQCATFEEINFDSGKEATLKFFLAFKDLQIAVSITAFERRV
jgi:hypothetical protein